MSEQAEPEQTAGKQTVVVVGGGYGGASLAKALDESFDVVLVEPKAAFQHSVAALRALVDPSWLPRIYLPYAELLAHGRVVKDRAATVDPGRVVTASGEEIPADYVVLASGSSYPFPAKTEHIETEDAHAQVRAAHAALDAADRVLLLGAGPVGIELAGEIRHVWPTKTITLVDPAGDILSGPFLPELREELTRQLVEARVEILLGSPLTAFPQTEPGTAGTFTVSTEAGTDITADVWFRCYGVVPNSDYLGPDLQAARQPDGFIDVLPTMQVAGHPTVFAIGDVSTADRKMAAFAAREAEVVAANITALAAGSSELTEYVSMGPGIAVPIGPNGGAGQFPGQDGIIGAEVVSQVKGQHMMVDHFAEIFGVGALAE